jgi:hypothetical protein
MKKIAIKIVRACKMTTLKSTVSLLGVAAGSVLLFQTAKAKAGIETAVGSDVSALAFRAITIESWDKDYTGGGYGWEVTTNKDTVQKGTKYDPKHINSQVEREVKLIRGTPQDIRENTGYENARILGVKFAFSFPGDNSVTIRPANVDQYVVERPRPFLNEVAITSDYKVPSCYKDPNYRSSQVTEGRAVMVDCINGIEMPGQVTAISVWVCGRGNEYDLEGWIEDWTGDTHIFKFGSVDFVGWRPMNVMIPGNIPQAVESFPPTKTLIFKKFLVRARPNTSLETVYLFFDELRVLTKLFEPHFDGAQIDFDRADCEKKNHLLRMIRENARSPELFGELTDCSKAPGPAAPINGGTAPRPSTTPAAP